MFDLVIHGGTVVDGTGNPAVLADVAIADGQIAAIGDLGTVEAEQQVEADGLVVCPGCIDPHTHYGIEFEELLSAEKQEYTWAAAWGGTTTICDFALQDSDQPLHEAIKDKKDEDSGRMAVDYGLHALLPKTPSFELIDQIGAQLCSGGGGSRSGSSWPMSFRLGRR